MGQGTVTILGCGPSGGVPLVGCKCATCASKNIKNSRLRASIHVIHEDISFLVDTSPDLRQQCLRHDISKVDAVIYTHSHADHLHGIDEIRSFNYHRDTFIDAYGTQEMLQSIEDRFPYVLAEKMDGFGWYKPCVTPHLVCDTQFPPIVLGDKAPLNILPFKQLHGKMLSLGIRVGDFAYSTDVNYLPEETFETLKGIKTWVVDCLQPNKSPTHAHLDLALEWIERVKPERAILTHMGHMLEYDTLKTSLPEGVEPAYDGMKLTFNV